MTNALCNHWCVDKHDTKLTHLQKVNSAHIYLLIFHDTTSIHLKIEQREQHQQILYQSSLIRYQDTQALIVDTEEIYEAQQTEFYLKDIDQIMIQLLSNKCSLSIFLDEKEIFLYDNSLTIDQQRFCLTTQAGMMFKLNLKNKCFDLSVKVNQKYQLLYSQQTEKVMLKATGQYIIFRKCDNIFNKFNINRIIKHIIVSDNYTYSMFLILKSILLDSYFDCQTITSFNMQLTCAFEYLLQLPQEQQQYNIEYIFSQISQLEPELCLLFFRVYVELFSRAKNTLTEAGLQLLISLIQQSLKLISKSVSQLHAPQSAIHIIYGAKMWPSGYFGTYRSICMIIQHLSLILKRSDVQVTNQGVLNQTVASLNDVLYGFYYENVLIQRRYYKFITSQSNYKTLYKNFYPLLHLRGEYQRGRAIGVQCDKAYNDCGCFLAQECAGASLCIGNGESRDILPCKCGNARFWSFEDVKSHQMQELIGKVDFSLKMTQKVVKTEPERVGNTETSTTPTNFYLSMLFNEVPDISLAFRRMKYDHFALFHLLHHFNHLTKWQQGVVLWEVFVQKVFLDVNQVNQGLKSFYILNSRYGSSFDVPGISRAHARRQRLIQQKIGSSALKGVEKQFTAQQNHVFDDSWLDVIDLNKIHIQYQKNDELEEIKAFYNRYLEFLQLLCDVQRIDTINDELEYQNGEKAHNFTRTFNSRQIHKNSYPYIVSKQKAMLDILYEPIFASLEIEKEIIQIQKQFKLYNDITTVEEQKDKTGRIHPALELLKEDNDQITQESQIIHLTKNVEMLQNMDKRTFQYEKIQDNNDLKYNDSKETCEICLSTILTFKNVVHLLCGHKMCFHCLKQITLICPFCKAPITSFCHQNFEFIQDPELIEPEEDEEEYS